MKVNIIYNKRTFKFLIKFDNVLFFSFPIQKLRSKSMLTSISLIVYNYMLLMKLLRMYGFVKPLINKRDY